MAALRPVAIGVKIGRRAGREVRDVALKGANDAVLAAVDAALASRLTAQIADRILEGPELERAIDRLVSSKAFERAIDQVLGSPAFERAVAEVVEGPLLEETVARLLRTEALWLLVDEIAHSPSVAEAIQQQSVGFVDEVAGGVRSRSRRIDDRIEWRVRRALGRGPRTPLEAGELAGE